MFDAAESVLANHVSLWDWRRRVDALYAAIKDAADPASSWREWRRGRDALFRSHAQTPLTPAARGRFGGLPFFDYDAAFRFTVDLVPAAGAQTEAITAGADGTVALVPFARTRGLASRLGKELVLYWIGGYGGGVFLPFADKTNGAATYAGGRYLLDTMKGADLGDAEGRVILDFNFAYNPSCAYSDRWVCPLSPAANRLPVAIDAGEQAPLL
jgi:uncharacterized protein (DUF1684 family)